MEKKIQNLIFNFLTKDKKPLFYNRRRIQYPPIDATASSSSIVDVDTRESTKRKRNSLPVSKKDDSSCSDDENSNSDDDYYPTSSSSDSSSSSGESFDSEGENNNDSFLRDAERATNGAGKNVDASKKSQLQTKEKQMKEQENLKTLKEKEQVVSK
jgi:hypothetical protein